MKYSHMATCALLNPRYKRRTERTMKKMGKPFMMRGSEVQIVKTSAPVWKYEWLITPKSSLSKARARSSGITVFTCPTSWRTAAAARAGGKQGAADIGCPSFYYR